MDWQPHLKIHSPTAATFLPPALVEETGWDILLALHSDKGCELSVGKLASIASISPSVLDRWLAQLEDRLLVAATRHRSTGELRPALTKSAREVLDHYLSATNGLQATIRH